MSRASQIERIISKGQLVPYRFVQNDIAGTQSATAMNLGAATDADTNLITESLIPFEFELVAVTVTSSEARTAGTLTVDATINGTATGLQAALDATNTTRHHAKQPRNTNTGVAGDRVGVKLTTASWTPVTADITATLYVLQHLEGI